MRPSAALRRPTIDRCSSSRAPARARRRRSRIASRSSSIDGADPRRILLLTFSRRASQEMIRRAVRAARCGRSPMAAAPAVGRHVPRGRRRACCACTRSRSDSTRRSRCSIAATPPTCSICVRDDRGLAKGERRFPQKDTCLAIYSRAVNARSAARDVLPGDAYPWCREHADALRALFAAYVEEKLRAPRARLRRPAAVVVARDGRRRRWRAQIRARFDHVLVDEYQDTNALQAEIVAALRPTAAA